jgi:D-3-phosphoglycerate dehydrogenase / 2-oxoglutarate reductase
MQISILEPDHFPEQSLKELAKLGKVTIYSGGCLKKFLGSTNVLFSRLKFLLTSEILENAPNLKYLCSPTTGLNHIDLNYCEQKSIKIISLKGQYTFLEQIRATPEHTLGLILALLRNYKKALNIQDLTEWDRNKYRGEEVFGNKIGIIGFGRVGRILSRYIQALGGEIYFYDDDSTIQGNACEIRCSSINDLISISNIIILCASYDIGKGPIIGPIQIDMMAGKYFVNTARGELVDEDYLFKMLERSHFKGLALDVIANEHLSEKIADRILLNSREDLILTPHIAGMTSNSNERTESYIVSQLLAEVLSR